MLVIDASVVVAACLADQGWKTCEGHDLVALSIQLTCPLVTLDRRLQRGVRGLVHVVSPAEL